MEMPTGYDLLEHSHEFRMHMLKRLAAGLIDATIIFLPVSLAIFLFNLEPKELLAGVLSGFGWFLYSAVTESLQGATLGKKALGLLVASIDGPMTISKGIVRNVPKMFWFIFLPIDLLIGLFDQNDPRKRWVDGVTRTTVISRKNEKTPTRGLIK
ncbi:MAG: RDD family protein [Methanomassiliicoccales archaeon]